MLGSMLAGEYHGPEESRDDGITTAFSVFWSVLQPSGGSTALLSIAHTSFVANIMHCEICASS